jgi:hypothetical protein
MLSVWRTLKPSRDPAEWIFDIRTHSGDIRGRRGAEGLKLVAAEPTGGFGRVLLAIAETSDSPVDLEQSNSLFGL